VPTNRTGQARYEMEMYLQQWVWAIAYVGRGTTSKGSMSSPTREGVEWIAILTTSEGGNGLKDNETLERVRQHDEGIR
jgi:hypothetical protein